MVQKKKSGPEKARKRLMRLAFHQTHLYRFVNMSYRNTIDFRTPNLKITMCETTLQALLWLPCIISRIKLQNPVILRQHLHLANSNGVELCQPFRLRYSFINEHGIQIFQV